VQALCATPEFTHRNFRHYLTFRLRAFASSFTLASVRESVGLSSGSVLLLETFGCAQGSFAKARIAGSQRIVRGRLPPAGGADRPAPVASRVGAPIRQTIGMGMVASFMRLAFRSIRSLPCAVQRIGQAAVKPSGQPPAERCTWAPSRSDPGCELGCRRRVG
jgi:hypothetical protein